MMFKLKQIDSETQLKRWLFDYPNHLIMQEDKSGITLTIEMDVGLQVAIWASDVDVLIDGINNLAPKPPQIIKPKAPKPKVINPSEQTDPQPRIVEKIVEVEKIVSGDKTVFIPMPVGAKPEQGYLVDEERGFTTYRRVEYNQNTRKFEDTDVENQD